MSSGNQPPGFPPGGGTPPPPSPYGAPLPGGDPASYSAVESISYGWNKFTQNLGPMLLITLGMFVVSGLVQVLTSVIQTGIGAAGPVVNNCDPTQSGWVECLTQPTTNTGLSLAATLTGLVISLLGSLVSVFLQGGLYRGAILIVDGQTPTVGEMFQGWAKGRYLVTMILTGLIITVGVILCIIPGIVAAFLLFWVPLMAVESESGSVTDPLKRSFDLVRNNIGHTLVFVILAILVTILGLLLCCVGLLATIPLLSIAMAYTIRRLEGRPVAP